MPGKIEIFKGTNDQYYFRLKAPNGQIIAVSEGYTRKRNALIGIASVKKYAKKAKVIELK